MGKSKENDNKAEDGLAAMTSAMVAANPLAARGLLAVMNESARFVTDRFRQDLDLQKAMLNCKSPTELMRLQTEFCQNALEQYAAEATRMVTIMTGATKDTVDKATSGLKRGYDDIPL